MTTYINIAKPVLPTYTRVNSVGREQYDQVDLTYDSSITFYDGVNQSLYTSVSKPTTSLIDSYSETNVSAYNSLYLTGASNLQGCSQSFTGVGQSLTSTKFYLKKSGSPTGSATATLYAHSGTFGSSSIPTGIALSTSGIFDVSTLTTSPALISFSFLDNLYEMTSGTKYVVALLYSDGDTSNFIQIGVRGSGSSHAGNAATLTGGIWTRQIGVDTAFYVYGTGYTKISKPI